MERQWYYAKSKAGQLGPVSESELVALIARGEVGAHDLVWSEGLSGWQQAGATELWARAQTAGTAPSASEGQEAPPPPAPAPAPAPAAPPAYGRPAPSLRSSGDSAPIPDGLCGWMKFYGIVSIAGGSLQCLSCIGILWGVPMILAGAALMGSARMLDELRTVEARLLPALRKLHTFFLIMGIFLIISLVMALIILAAYLTFGIALLSAVSGAAGKAATAM